jgi:hypothetical protein
MADLLVVNLKANPVFKKRLKFDRTHLGKEGKTEAELFQELVEYLSIFW